MPIIIAGILRIVIMALISAIPLTLAQEVLDGTLKKLVGYIRDDNGLTEGEAKDILGNFVIDLILNAAVVGVVMKSRVALKAADYLGFTSRGFVKKALTPAAEKVSAKIVADGGKSLVLKSLPSVWKILGTIGGGIWLINGIAATIEPGIYKPEQTNAVYKKLGIPFEYPTAQAALKPGPFDSDQFKDYANSLEQVGVKGFNDPFALQSRTYSRQALADLIEGVYGREIVNGNAPTYKQIIPLLAPYIISDSKTSGFSSSSTKSTTSSTPASTIKIFTGIVSQGVLGNETSFTPREDDLILNTDELKTAVIHNLAPYIASLPSKIIYELKIVSQVTGKNGFIRRGAVHKVVVGRNADGTAKYKTITNKFAIVNLYIKTEQGTKSKISSIVLGPTDAVNFRPTETDLGNLEQNIKTEVFSTNPQIINQVQGQNLASVGSEKISTNAPVQVVAKPQMNLPQYKLDGTEFVDKDRSPAEIYRIKNDELWTLFTYQELTTQEEKTFLAQSENKFSVIEPKLKLYGIDFAQIPSVPYIADIKQKYLGKSRSVSLAEFFGGVPTTTLPVNITTEKPGANATNLSEWYTAQGQNLPDIDSRANLYEAFGLGSAGLYTGTAEQNIKLLAKLKEK